MKELLLRIWPGGRIHSIAQAETYAQVRVGTTELVEVGDTYTALADPYTIVRFRVVSTRVEVISTEPLEGKIWGMCEELVENPLQDAAHSPESPNYGVSDDD